MTSCRFLILAQSTSELKIAGGTLSDHWAAKGSSSSDQSDWDAGNNILIMLNLSAL